MCSTSNLTEALRGMEVNNNTAMNGSGNNVQMVSAGKLKHSREKYYLVDVREPDEIQEDPVYLAEENPLTPQVDEELTMGRIFLLAKKNIKDGSASSLFQGETYTADKIIVFLCNTGYRASLTAMELAKYMDPNKVAVLTRGLIGLRNPAATLPDFVVALNTHSDAEKITLAITACSTAASQGETVILALLGDGVNTFIRKGNNKQVASETSFRIYNVFVGEPFKPCDNLLKKFLETGNGIVLGCTSCVKSRNLDFGSDLLDCVQPMQMPDFLRMLGEANKTLQFS